MRIFAEKGFVAATVGEIEDAAGLQPRRGALYNHFESKEALLRSAIEAQVDGVRERAAGVRNRALAGAGRRRRTRSATSSWAWAGGTCARSTHSAGSR